VSRWGRNKTEAELTRLDDESLLFCLTVPLWINPMSNQKP